MNGSALDVLNEVLTQCPTGVTVANFTVAANNGRYDPVTGDCMDKGATFLLLDPVPSY